MYSTLRNDKKNRLSGLLAVELKSVAGASTLPARVSDNVDRNAAKEDIGYARYIAYPATDHFLRDSIQDAHDARFTRKHLINNKRDRRVINSPCP